MGVATGLLHFFSALMALAAYAKDKMLQMSCLAAPANPYNPALVRRQSLPAVDQPVGHCCGAEQASDSVELSGPSAIDPTQPTPPRTEAHRQQLGLTLWDRFQEGKIDLLAIQVSGRNDGADARSNIADTALGRQAKRSSYENAPGGRVALSFPLLEGLKTLSDDHSYRITALAGGSHSARSRHYLGVGFDVDQLDGMPVNKDNPNFRDFMAKARAMGATEVLGPGNGGHDNHIHVSWPREAAG